MSRPITRGAFLALRARVEKTTFLRWCDLLRPLTGWAPWRVRDFVHDKTPAQIRAYARGIEAERARTT